MGYGYMSSSRDGKSPKCSPPVPHMRGSHLLSRWIQYVCLLPLMILATSEVPYTVLPLRIRQFFKSEISNYSHFTPLEHTVPRFSVQVDGNFNRDLVINSSAAKLSRDVVQQFVQLIHHRSHIYTSSCTEYKTCNTVKGNTDHGSANEREGSTQCPEDSLIKVPPPATAT
ncbi:hypothetical protein L1049_000589 [Liquidambar formosana]|uniref:Uncharacterized protein n=1 Tax=Liquidambar formosana TaxID=63359 RepID=A0AAP0N997_LIQFO